MKRRSISVSGILLVLVWGCGNELAREPAREPPPMGAEPSRETLQQLTEALRERSGAPGALLGVARGDLRWHFAAGAEDLLGQRPMAATKTFRAGSIMKLLSLDEIAALVGFASAITLRQAFRRQFGQTPTQLRGARSAGGTKE